MSTATKSLKQIRLGDEYNPPLVPLPDEQSLPPSLASLSIWIVWEIHWDPEDQKWKKMPHQLLPTGQAQMKGWNTPGNQTTLATCLKWIQSKPKRKGSWGVGFIGKEHGACALDFDDVLDEAGNIKNSDVAAWVESTKRELFWEQSVSGSGLHAFGNGLELNGQGKNFPLVKGGSFETLVGNRFCAVTGNRFAESALELGDLSPIYKEVSREAKQDKNHGEMTVPATETPRNTGVSMPTFVGGKDFREVLRDRARAYVEKMPPSVSGSDGHGALMDAAVNLVKGWGYGDPFRAEMWEEDGRAIFEEYNARAIPPESREQVDHKWNSAKKGTAEGKDLYAGALKDHEEFKARHPPSGSPHATTSKAAKGDWGPIGTVEDDEAREVKRPPLHTLPGKIANYIRNQAERMNAPEDFGALALLVSAGSMVGNAGIALLKGGRRVSCVIWGAGVANPGKTKSAPMEEMTEQIKDADSRFISEHNKKMRRWRQAKEEFEKGEHGGTFTKPQPQQQALYLNDFTIEKLASTHSVNPKGLLVYQDEITQFVRSMNQYNAGGGSDRSKHLEAWGSAQMKVSRKGAPCDLVVKRPHYGILGTIQPDFLSELATQKGNESSRDGFIDRFLFVYPKELPARGAVDVEKDLESERALKAMFTKLIELDVKLRLPGTGIVITANAWRDGEPINGFDEDAPDAPGSDEFVADVRDEDCLVITKEGWEAWKKVSAAFADERNGPHLEKALDGAWSKLEAYYLRIANIIQHIWWACGEAAQRNISAEAIEAAAEWAHYLKDHIRKAYGVMAQKTLGKDAVVGLDWVKKQKGETFTKSDIRTGIRSRLNRCPKRLAAVLDELESANVIRPVEMTKTDGRGRGKPPVRYEINPAIRER